LGDEVRKWFFALDFSEDVVDGFDDLRLVGMPQGVARLFQRLAKEIEVPVGQIERKPHTHNACPKLALS
jgi:hypothetical protein